MAFRLRPARIEDVVDGAKLRVQLTAAALDGMSDDDLRKRALQLLHHALFRGRIIAKERLEHGASGLETARLLAKVADEVIEALFDFVTTHVFRARNPTEGERFTIVAVGGYGRRQLAPSSDIDLLFLRAYKQTPWSESVTEYMLYMLWDMGLKVGHASRTVDECVRLAKEDHTIQTALLEARRISGDQNLFEEFKRRFDKDVVSTSHRSFILAKLKERDERHTRSGASRYMVEPNVKEGKGGLRDLHTLYWITKHVYGVSNLKGVAELSAFTKEEISTLQRAGEFLWRTRCHLHFLTGRAEERITFDLQPEMAQVMGFGARGELAAVERFMKRYFLVAKDIGGLTRILCAKLEADHQKRAPSLAKFMSSNTYDLSPASGFKIEAGRLTPASLKAFSENPITMLKIFALADQRNLDIHPEALTEITRALRKMSPAMRRDPEAARLFCEIAASPNNPGRTLTLMNEAGVLGRFMPEFGRVVAQMQFNMYHHYTVDEHTLQAVDIISGIEHGRYSEDHPLATMIFPKIIHRRALYLAMLLHDTGKGIGDQQEEGEKTAIAACERLGLPAEEIELVGWLVGNHLEMSDVAQKRDIGDPRTIATFAKRVGTLEKLRLLLVLTVADIRAVGPGVWNSWKGQLLRDLYRLTEAVFHGGRTDEAGVRERIAEQSRDAREKLLASWPVEEAPELSAWLDRFDDAYLLSFDRNAVSWHFEEAAEARRMGGAHVAARADSRRGVTEVLVYAPDRPGLFARLARAFAAAFADVTDARVNTTKDGAAFDIFSIQDSSGDPFGIDDPRVLDQLLIRIRTAATGDAPALPVPKKAPHRRMAAFKIEPWVRFDNELSHASTVIEVSGRDRPGVLADLSRVLAEAGLSINSAHIDSHGERVGDVFYVQTLEGGKLVDEARTATLRDKLTDVLREGEPEAPSTVGRQKLAVAPASQLR
jgi:[protein-PII] uridylyltransferase